MLAYARLSIGMALIVAACGCALAPRAGRGKSPLAPFKPAVESSTLEVVFVRFPYELPALNEELWPEIDESLIHPEVRQALEQNGFRAGVITSPFPVALEAVLCADQPPAAGDVTEPSTGNRIGKLEVEPLVRRRTLHALPGQRSELLASGVYERLPLLVRDVNGVHGQTYAKAQCVLAAKTVPQGDRRIQLSLAPEVQHGEHRREIRGDDGVFRFDSTRPKVSLDKMAIDVVLSPGQAIILGTRTERPGSVGHYFFTEPQGGQLEQKLMLVRFDGTKYDNLLVSGDGDGRSAEQELRR